MITDAVDASVLDFEQYFAFRDFSDDSTLKTLHVVIINTLTTKIIHTLYDKTPHKNYNLKKQNVSKSCTESSTAPTIYPQDITEKVKVKLSLYFFLTECHHKCRLEE
jgi:hypothetical protein